MRSQLLVLSLLSALALPAQLPQVVPTTCHTVEVPVSADVVERRLLTCAGVLPDNVLWHLDRSDSVNGALNGQVVRTTTGRGAVIYVMDTGVMRSHVEFQRATGSNVLDGIDAGGYAQCDGAEVAPCYAREFPLQALFFGHGTGVASVAAGARVGVAPDASIVPVLYNDAPSLDRALHAIIQHAFAPTTPQFRTGIINFSLSLDVTQWVPAVAELMTRMTTGVDVDGNADPNGKRFFFTAAAGNHNADEQSPGNQCGPGFSVKIYPAVLGTSIDGLVTVGGIDRNNAMWAESCRGPLVELLAPAGDMLVASIVENDGYRWKPEFFASGTSWASPYVAGMAARLLEANPELTPAQIEQELKASPSRVEGLPVPVRVEVETPPPGGRRRVVRH